MVNREREDSKYDWELDKRDHILDTLWIGLSKQNTSTETNIDTINLRDYHTPTQTVTSPSLGNGGHNKNITVLDLDTPKQLQFDSSTKNKDNGINSGTITPIPNFNNKSKTNSTRKIFKFPKRDSKKDKTLTIKVQKMDPSESFPEEEELNYEVTNMMNNIKKLDKTHQREITGMSWMGHISMSKMNFFDESESDEDVPFTDINTNSNNTNKSMASLFVQIEKKIISH